MYEGDAFKRDSSYHQGITWVWLLGLYYNALKNSFKAETLMQLMPIANFLGKLIHLL